MKKREREKKITPFQTEKEARRRESRSNELRE